MSGGEIAVGLLVLGFAVDDALALEVRRQSGAEIAYVVPGASPRVIATTLPDASELEDVFQPSAFPFGIAHGAVCQLAAGDARSGKAPPVTGALIHRSDFDRIKFGFQIREREFHGRIDLSFD